jgi:general secretion pathway protein L
LLTLEKQRLQTSMEKRFREAFPDARVVVDAPLQMQRNLAELRGAAGQLTTDDFLPLLGRTAGALDADSRSGVRAIGFEAGELRLDIALADQAAADALIGRLAGAGLDSQLQDVSGAAPQSLARIVIKGSAQ